ncbi:SSI family serine proteinase inhibitor [Streptomyces sp. H51]|uniref:SSI family serine proteinase inhibitor n=1 Tax=Streptomyces sp. H51 TaxID=3111770 RepID=UPI002D79360A|nr:SSI family serine proteinase inhibitor [Streptomyces sp. H51]
MTTSLKAKAVRDVLVAAALLLAGAAPAQAAARHHAPDEWLYLTVARGDATAGAARDASAGAARDALLLCDPPQGHARAAEACADLAAVDGDIGALPARNTPCPMVYAPVTVRARGQWHGRPIDYTHTFANSCVLQARTGTVFALDDD